MAKAYKTTDLSQLEYFVSTPRRLTPDEIRKLRIEMADARFMTGLTQRQWECIPEVLVAIGSKGELMGILALVPMLADNWFELGPVYTFKAFRRKGVMSSLLQEAKILVDERNIFITSHNEDFVTLLEKFPPYNQGFMYRELSLMAALAEMPLLAKWYMFTSRFRPSLIREGLRKKRCGIAAKGTDHFWIKA